MKTRRDFLATSAALSAGALLPSRVLSAAPPPAPEPMKLLILGGTAFLGPHLVDAAKARGHEITLFNRGRTNADLFPELEKLRGDRDPEKGDGLKALEEALGAGRAWDAVIDTSGYVPRIVTASASLLAEHVPQYLFVSTLSVYADRSVDVTESSPVIELEDPTTEQVGRHYGGLKALCEQAAEAAMPGRATNVRPGLIVGPLDRSDRFTYWPVRIERGGEVMAPGAPAAPIQIIDVRDLAIWCIHLIEQRTHGVFNAIGPAAGMSMQEFLHGCKVVIGSDASFTWVDDAFLLDTGVRAYSEVPLWIPREGPPYGTSQMQPALARGLTLRPVGDTIRDTLAWAKTRPEDHRWRAGLAAAKETEILESWRARSSGG